MLLEQLSVSIYPLSDHSHFDLGTGTVYFGYSGHGYSGQSVIVDSWAGTESFPFILV